MKLKVLDCALITLLSGAAPTIFGQTAVPAPQGAVQAAAQDPLCTAASCRSNGELLFQLQTRGARDPVTHGTSDRSTSEALQPDRRVTVELQKPETGVEQRQLPGKAVAVGRFSMQLPNGGVIWATEDPTLGVPELSVSAPSMVPFDNGRVQDKVQFFVRSNYPDFIQRYELKIYRSTDTALTEALAVVPMSVGAVSRGAWDGATVSRYPLRVGDELIYVLRAFSADGSVDETYPQTLRLVRPDEAERGEILLRNSLEKSIGTGLTSDQAQAQRLLANVFSGSSLRQQNIPIYGSRVRIQGRNLPPDYNLLINGDDYPVDLERKFVAEFLAPVGVHRFDVLLKGEKLPSLRHQIDVDVTGKYFFGVAIADMTIFQNSASGPGRALALNGREEDVLANGRLGFYAKAKIDGKYLITAQADTQERDIRDLFSGFGKADPTDVFRQLDPNQYLHDVWRRFDHLPGCRYPRPVLLASRLGQKSGALGQLRHRDRRHRIRSIPAFALRRSDQLAFDRYKSVG